MTELKDLVRTERLAFIDLLKTLTEDQWRTPSPCKAWTVENVVAHLAWAPVAGPLEMGPAALRAGFRTNRLLADSAVRWTERGRPAIFDQLRRNVESDAKPLGMPPVAALTDAVVHGLNVRVPLGQHRDVDPEAFRLIVDWSVTSRWPMTVPVGGNSAQATAWDPPGRHRCRLGLGRGRRGARVGRQDPAQAPGPWPRLSLTTVTMRREVTTMFGQVVQGHTADPAGVREAMQRWVHDLSPGAAGWLGSTAGVTEDGTFIAVVRFDSEQAARANSDRPEQDQWWAEASRLLDGEVTVRDGVRTEAYRAGDPDQAGFVQVVQGRVSDLDRARGSLHALQEALKVHLPCLLGSVTIVYDADRFTRALYFSTEEQARAGELNVPPELRRRDDEARALLVGAIDFLDLREPWLYAAR